MKTMQLLGILALYFFNANPEYGTGRLTFDVLELINNLRVPTGPVFAGLWLDPAALVGRERTPLVPRRVVWGGR